MTTDCLRLDDYLDGRLSESDAETFEAHTLACADCDAALDASLAIADLAVLRDVTCPPAVLDAALTRARRAPDRAPQPRARSHRPRFTVLALGLMGAVALAIGLARMGTPEAPMPVVAEAVPAIPEAEEVVSESAAPSQAEPESPLVDEASSASSTPPPSAPRSAPAPAPPSPAAPTEATTPLADAIAQSDLDPEPTPEDIEDARRDIALAFALVAEAQSRAGDAVRAHAGPVSSTIDHALPF